MVFNSISFAVFFILFYFVYWAVNKHSNTTVRNLLIILASYLFYGWWDWRFLGLIVLSSTVDFVIGAKLFEASKSSVKKRLLYTSIGVNLGVLGFFKYFNFFAESLSKAFYQIGIQLDTVTLDIILPVGISFYTFQTLSYTIDIYRGKIKPTKDLISFFSFVSFFPQLVAGPIERASHLLPQFSILKSFDYKNTVSGLRLVLWGFFKKVVIADNFGVLADSIFEIDAELSSLSVVFGSIFFALQIYADFSGYSDIAIGIARMLGFNLRKNFTTPYFAKSFGEFWERWHISLSTWFRDYVYIPLGGNRNGKLTMYMAIFITFVLSGLWHGAETTFLIWGALHGLILIAEKSLSLTKLRWIYTPFVICSVILLWIPFRAEDLSHLIQLSESLTDFSSFSLINLPKALGAGSGFSLQRLVALLLVTLAFVFVEWRMRDKDFSEWISTLPKWVRIGTYYILVFLILIIGNFSVKPSFIYFQF